MKPILILAALIVASAVVYFSIEIRSSVDARVEEQRAALAAEAARSEKLVATLEKLSARVEELDRRTLETPRVDREVAKSESDGAEKSKGTSTGEPAKPAGKEPTRELGDLLSKLSDPMTSYEQKQALWKELAEKGLLDEAIAALKAKADADPSNPDAQVELASGYLQKLYSSKNPLETGGWAMKMDQCYDKALELDPNHWNARFSKAISYSFWPAITGKPQEAVKQFETLIAQQEKSSTRPPQYATTYELLGNLYKQQGKLDLAKQTYAKGLSFFPDNKGLKTAADGL